MSTDSKSDLKSVLARAAKTVQEQRGKATDEEKTKLWLIQPVLAALGWVTCDPALVCPEWRRHPKAAKKADYALLGPNGKPVAIVEAKRLHLPLEEMTFIEQAVQYAHNAGVSWALLSNGFQWRLYEIISPGKPAEERLVWSVEVGTPAAVLKIGQLERASLVAGGLDGALTANLSLQSLEADLAKVVAALDEILLAPTDALLDALAARSGTPASRIKSIWPALEVDVNSLEGDDLGQWHDANLKPNAGLKGDGRSSATSTAAGTSTTIWLGLDQAPPIRRKPQYLNLGGNLVELKSWAQLITEVARWAERANSARWLEAMTAPEFALRNGQRLLAKSRSGMNRPEKVGSGHLETNLSASSAVANAQKIAQYFFGATGNVLYSIAPDAA